MKRDLYIINEDGTGFLLVRSEKSVHTPSSDAQLSKGQLQMKLSAISSLLHEFSKKCNRLEGTGIITEIIIP